VTAVSRRFFAPEIVQTSAMDCGPASLKSLLEGHGIPVSYGRLREACQTDVDGTSIDTIEEIARDLGLAAEQVMLPVDHLFVRDAQAFPGMLVVVTPNGATHFVVVWSQIGPLVQLMDPATGRRWTTASRLASELFVHTMPVSASAFEEWVRADDFLVVIRRILARLGASSIGEGLLAEALGREGWHALAALDASVRMVMSLVETNSLRKGAEVGRALRSLYQRARDGEDVVPEPFWTARAMDPDADGEPQVRLRGAVLVRIAGKRADCKDGQKDGQGDTPSSLSPELAKALEEAPARPLRDLVAVLRRDGLFEPSAVALGTIGAVCCAVAEALLLRGVLDIGRRLGIFEQRLGAGAALVIFTLVVLALELVLERRVLRLGRRLETRFRIAFQTKIPRLGDRYFQSRPASDMAERAHGAHALRTLPDVGVQLVRSCLELVVTTAALVWIDPKSAPLAIALGVVSVATPLLSQGVLNERDLKLRTHAGALMRFHLDALLALTPLRAHGGERALMREHESLLAEWMRAGRSLVRASTAMQAVQAVLGCAVTIALVAFHVARSVDPTSLLLFLYWALSLPTIGEELGVLARQYPSLKNRTLRLLEPLGAIDEGQLPTSARAPSPEGVRIAFEAVSAVVGGRTILEDVSVAIAPGEHVAIVGASGAGKSSLVGLLLGWHRPARGRILVDGTPLEGDRVAELRRESAWVDPAVQLWNTSLYENLRYGNDTSEPVGNLVDPTGLRSLVEQLPDGLQTSLGEGGALVSGGEGQRVRMGRALARRARLAVLDEPVRGLDRTSRSALVTTARERFRDATLLFVSHDIEDTLAFDRVLVIEDGRVVEDGLPAALAADEASHYRALLDADRRVRERIWRGTGWRHVIVSGGSVVENGEPAAESREEGRAAQ
jgi:ATP-binding cassette subfamily B protein